MLIKRLYKIAIAILLTIILALSPLFSMAAVTELQGYTYSPAVGQLTTVTTTQTAHSGSTPIVFSIGKESTIEKLSVEEEILRVFPDAPIMVEVARCESQLDPLADRGNLNVDVGLFQINQVHVPRLIELGYERRNIHDNIAYARMLYDANGLNDWYMSRDCWSKAM